ncbi:hypothetical protein DY000_02021698 [Brassica cretica]|uniref:Uncharacterized protein n=1 Tax=Brassica cretica TaxID=69181 RepID=A0ABQ7EE81_BRACR|nr:hypothetical protein DY000_02021698 [Brassica cretica]
MKESVAPVTLGLIHKISGKCWGRMLSIFGMFHSRVPLQRRSATQRSWWTSCIGPTGLNGSSMLSQGSFHTRVLSPSPMALLRPQVGHRPLDPRWKGPRFSGSPLGGTPFPRYEVLRVLSLGPPPSPGKRKTSDKENLPYFRICKNLTYSNRLRLALRRLYKGNLNPKARGRHFKT